MSVTYDGAEYFYLKNAQGDVTGLVASSGTQVVAYTYDAWGNPLTTAGTMADTLGKLNPFRYRGYVYDTETGLYYLGSRYYNPQWGRFVNADGLVDTEDLLGGNLFAYCGNSPVARRDTTGQFWDTVFDIVSLCISVKNVISNPKSGSAWLGLAADVLCLAIPGLTGGGSAVRATKTINRAVSAAKAADNISDGARLARAADKIGDSVRLSERASGAAKVVDTALSANNCSKSGLSFGIKSYSTLKKETKELGLEVHHIVEKRFADSLGVVKNSMPSIALTHDHHAVYTKAWRQNLPYGRTYSPTEIWSAAQRVYANDPELLNASRITIFGS